MYPPLLAMTHANAAVVVAPNRATAGHRARREDPVPTAILVLNEAPDRTALPSIGCGN